MTAKTGPWQHSQRTHSRLSQLTIHLSEVYNAFTSMIPIKYSTLVLIAVTGVDNSGTSPVKVTCDQNIKAMYRHAKVMAK